MPDDVRPPMRTYTVRAHRPAAAEIDVDFVLHGDSRPGLGVGVAAWHRATGVTFAGPYGLYDAARGRDWQLLVGDETALPAIGAIIEQLPAGTRGLRRTSRSRSAQSVQTFETRGAVEVHWLLRGSRPPGRAVAGRGAYSDFPGGAPYAWVSGEAGVVKLVRRHLVREREVDKRRICFTGYWRHGISEEAASREAVRAADAGEVPADED